MKGLQGRFILSLNDVAEVRETFAAFHLEEVEVLYRIRRVKRFFKLIISG